MNTCKPYDKATDSGGFCFGSLLCKVLGEPYDDECLPCFRAAGYQPTVSNDSEAGTNP